MGQRTAGTEPAPRRRVRLEEVARRAGVSLATASKVMNGRAAVSAATREAVAEAAQELGYTPRRRAAPEAPRSVAVHLQSVDSPYVMGVLAGITHATRRAGVELLLSSSEGEGLDRAWMTEVAARGAAGLVALVTPIAPQHARWSRSLSLPLVAVDPIVEGELAPGVVSVTSTNWEGGASAVRHLLELGHRRIGMLAGPRDSVPAQQRLEGYVSALAKAGLPIDEGLVIHSPFREADGRRGTAALLDLAEPPTAVFGASDALAVGALREARARGIGVPEGLSVVGFDDTMITGWTSPQLTAVRQPLFAMGQVAVERLLALAADPGVFSHPFKLETQLVARESTGPAPR